MSPTSATPVAAPPADQNPAGLDVLADVDQRLLEELGEHPLPSDDERDLQARFEEFHADNPHVYDRLHLLAVNMIEQGYKTIGIGMLWEVMRWQTMVETRVAGTEPKLNNNHRSRYARLLMANDERLKGVFNIRELRS